MRSAAETIEAWEGKFLHKFSGNGVVRDGDMPASDVACVPFVANGSPLSPDAWTEELFTRAGRSHVVARPRGR